jgi:hypothetical protein
VTPVRKWLPFDTDYIIKEESRLFAAVSTAGPTGRSHNIGSDYQNCSDLKYISKNRGNSIVSPVKRTFVLLSMPSPSSGGLVVRRGPEPRSKGSQTQAEILSHAVKIASLEGLAGLTIGRLAEELKMSKSGLFAHFRSKQRLELATIEHAWEIFF